MAPSCLLPAAGPPTPGTVKICVQEFHIRNFSPKRRQKLVGPRCEALGCGILAGAWTTGNGNGGCGQLLALGRSGGGGVLQSSVGMMTRSWRRRRSSSTTR